MSNYIKGRRREYRAQKLLEACGFSTVRAASSKGFADVIAIRGREVRCISVKSGGAYASAVEREALQRLADLAEGGTISFEIWRFPRGAREPLIEEF